MTALYENISRTNMISGAPISVNDGEARDIYSRAWRLGIVAGLRSTMPLALLAWTEEAATNGNEGAGSSRLRSILGLVTLAEVISDKLPLVPGRLRPGSLTGRLVSGALAGALLSRRFQQPVLPGAINGALGAGLGALVGAAGRFILSGLTPLPDMLWATLEDGIALRLGLSALKQK